MIFEFKTKRNTNGNTLKLRIDTDGKTYEKGYFISQREPVVVTKRDMDALAENCKAEGYKRV